MAGITRPHAESLDGCKIQSTVYFMHLFDHLALQYGGLPVSREEMGTLRQQPFLVFTSGIHHSDLSEYKMRLVYKAHRWMFTRTQWLLKVSSAYASLVLDDRYMVSPQDWHPTIREAFGLEDPPTPQEVFSLFHTKYVPYHREMKKTLSVHEACLLDYYCLGGQIPALAACYRVTPERVVWLLAQSIKRLMNHVFFALWATGSDLTPLMTDKTTRDYCDSVMGKGRSGREGGLINNTASAYITAMRRLDKLRDTDPYYNMIVYEGMRLNPIQRAYTKVKWAWDTIEQKRASEAQWWYILFTLREQATSYWLRMKLMCRPTVPDSTRLYFVPDEHKKMPNTKFRRVFVSQYSKELVKLYGQDTLDEARVATIRAKWADAFYARTGRYPKYGASGRPSEFLAKRPANGQDPDDLQQGD